MKSGFKNPIAPREKEKEAKNPWNFKAPCYDERNNICAGNDYGEGFRQPVGKTSASMANCPVPKGDVATMSVSRSDKNLAMYE